MERLPGFRDFYPEPLPHKDVWSADARQYIFGKWRDAARRYGFREYDGPPLEPLELFTTKSGDEIVGQLYNFKDKGDREIALRPEMTPTLARMVAAHERNYKKPIKWFAVPQLFRYERQQKGRLREHFQHEEEGDYLHDVLVRRPGLQGQVARLQSQHGTFLSEGDALSRALLGERAPRDWPARVVRLLEGLRRHEIAEVDLMQRAFLDDLGSGG